MVLTVARKPADRWLGGFKALVFGLSLLPLLHLAWQAEHATLGANPVETLQRQTGAWTFNFLLLTLAVTPLCQLTGRGWPMRLRHLLGLFALLYGTLHLLCFAGFEHDFDALSIAQDVLDRRFIFAGSAAWLLMLPLAITSPPQRQRALGGARWKALHRSIYLIGLLATVHYFWLAKTTVLLWPIAYAGAHALVLGWRMLRRSPR